MISGSFSIFALFLCHMLFLVLTWEFINSVLSFSEPINNVVVKAKQRTSLLLKSFLSKDPEPRLLAILRQDPCYASWL